VSALAIVGDPLQDGGLPLPSADILANDSSFVSRFCAKVALSIHSDEFGLIPGVASGCWLWQARRNKDGYGQFRVGRTIYFAHRVAFMLGYGRWPSSSLMVLHSCDTPGCVNPAHLREGAATDNLNDTYARGRRKKRPGIEHWRDGRASEAILRGGSVLDAYTVRAIREKVAESGGHVAARRDMTAALLALEVGTTEAAVINAARGETFAWVFGGAE